MLDLGVVGGGGHHLLRIAKDFDVTGVDLSPEMPAHARRLNPTAKYHEGDIREIRLRRVCVQ